MMIAPIAAAAAAPTTTAPEGATLPGAEGFEETMAAILGLAIQAPTQPATQQVAPEIGVTTTEAVPAPGMPFEVAGIDTEPGDSLMPAETVIPTAVDSALQAPRAESPEATVPTTPTLPHPGVRFPERRLGQPAIQPVVPTVTGGNHTEEVSPAPSLATRDTESRVGFETDPATSLTQTATLTVASAAVTAASQAPSTGSGATRADDAASTAARALGPVARIATPRTDDVDQPTAPMTARAAVDQPSAEEAPTPPTERRGVDTPAASGMPGTETQVTAVEPSPTHVGGHAVDGDAPVPSALLQRVEEVVRRLENAPPPRSITLSIDDQGLTKVTVSVLSDGVRLTVPEGSQAPTGLVGQLERALESRGFDLSQDGRRQRHQDEESETPWVPTAAPQQRTETDAAVRL